MRLLAPIAAALALLVICLCARPAAAQDSVISSLANAASLTGTEAVPLDQGTCPGTPPTCTTVHTTLSAIKTWIAPGTVTSIAVTVPAWLTPTGCTITISGACAITATAESANTVLAGPTTGSAAASAFRALVAADIPSLSYAPAASALTNSLTSDVTATNASQFYDGPSVANATTSGWTWYASGTITYAATASDIIACKLWDGTTTIASAAVGYGGTANKSISLSGIITSPAGNLRISCEDQTNAGVLAIKATGSAVTNTASTISALRIN